MSTIDSYLHKLLARVPELAVCEAELGRTLQAMLDCATADRTMFFCGNGGSYADAEHMAGELIKSFAIPRPLPPTEQTRLTAAFGDAGAALASGLQRGIRAQTLASHPAFLTAMANDVGWDLAFAQQLYVFGRSRDLLIGLSTSGRSSNILQAMRVARARELVVIGMTGADGGSMVELADICIRAPAASTPRVQEFHQIVYHWLCASLEAMVFTEMDEGLD